MKLFRFLISVDSISNILAIPWWSCSLILCQAVNVVIPSCPGPVPCPPYCRVVPVIVPAAAALSEVIKCVNFGRKIRENIDIWRYFQTVEGELCRHGYAVLPAARKCYQQSGRVYESWWVGTTLIMSLAWWPIFSWPRWLLCYTLTDF